MAERLLDDNPPIGVILFRRQAVIRQLLDNRAEEARRNGQIEDDAARKALRQCRVQPVVGEISGEIVKALCKFIPRLALFAVPLATLAGVERTQFVAEHFSIAFLMANAENLEAIVQVSATAQGDQGRHQQAGSQVAGSAEDNQRRGRQGSRVGIPHISVWRRHRYGLSCPMRRLEPIEQLPAGPRLGTRR